MRSIVLIDACDFFFDEFFCFILKLISHYLLEFIELFLGKHMNLWIDSSREILLRFCIDFITIEFESWNREKTTGFDISSLTDNLTIRIIDVSDEDSFHSTDRKRSARSSARRYANPVRRTENKSIIRDKSSIWSEGLFSREFIENINCSVSISSAIFIDRRDIEWLLKGRIDGYRLYRDGEASIERIFRVRFWENKISGNCFYWKFWRDIDIRLRYGKIKNKCKESERNHKSEHEHEHIGIFDNFRIFIDFLSSVEEEKKSRKYLLYLIHEILKKCEIMTKNVIFFKSLFEFDIIIFHITLDSYWLGDFLDNRIWSDDREFFSTISMYEKLKIDIVHQCRILITLEKYLTSIAVEFDFFDNIDDTIISSDLDAFLSGHEKTFENDDKMIYS